VDEQHFSYMRQAIELSRQHMQAGTGGPFGAVIVQQGVVIAQGWNKVTSTNDPTAHAEVVAIRRACQALGTFSLKGAVLYSSCEPCPMCLSASYWARIDRLFFANTQAQAAAIGFDDAFLYAEVAKPFVDRLLPMQHIPMADAASVFDDWLNKADRIEY
jgi:guanine deaminase